MYLDNIENYFIKKQNNCEFATWDYGLKTLQQNAFNNLRFNEENKKLMQDFIDEDYEMATDEFGNPLTF
jgi:hypothetical protein